MKKETDTKQKRYINKMKDEGFYWLCHWVPIEFKERIKEYAKKLRKKQ